MSRTKHMLSFLLIILLTSFKCDVIHQNDTFTVRVEDFLSTLSSDYNLNKERFTNSTFNEQILEKDTTVHWHKTTTFSSKKKFRNHYKQLVRQRLYFGFHQYSSETECNQAFASLLHCLGTDCQELSWNDDTKRIKTTPFVYVKTKNEIVFCKVHCEHTNPFWGELKSRMEEFFAIGECRIITAECGGPVDFKSR